MKITRKKTATPARLVLLLTAIIFPDKVRIGVATAVTGERIHVAAIRYGERWYPLLTMKKMPVLFRLWFPQRYYTDAGPVPLYLHTEEKKTGDDADVCIEKNESSFIPPGFGQEKLITGYATYDSGIMAATVVKDQFDEYVSDLERTGVIVSCIPALQGLANMLGKEGHGSCFIWKFEPDGSTLAMVNDGRVVANCRFWAGDADVREQGSQVCSDAHDLLTSMDESHRVKTLVCFPESIGECVAGQWSDSSIAVIRMPPVDACTGDGIEAYGNLLDMPETVPNIVTFDRWQTIVKTGHTVKMTMRAMRYATVAVAGLFLVCAGYVGVSNLCIKNDRETMEKIDGEYSGIMLSMARRDSLFSELSHRSAFIAEESALTRLLTELQDVFPEEAAAEEISIMESDAESWRITIRAFARSTLLIQPVINNMQKIRGLKDVRMMYSEQVEDKNHASGIRFKVEGIWR